HGRSVVDGKAGESTERNANGGGLDPHEWGLRFTPPMTRHPDPDTTYDAAGRPIAVAIDERTEESFWWDDADRIVRWTDASGITSHYGYDDLNRPASIHVNGIVIASAEYDERGRLSRRVDSYGVDSYHYDDTGKIDRIAL